jgi:hypothetical protein
MNIGELAWLFGQGVSLSDTTDPEGAWVRFPMLAHHFLHFRTFFACSNFIRKSKTHNWILTGGIFDDLKLQR